MSWPRRAADAWRRLETLGVDRPDTLLESEVEVTPEDIAEAAAVMMESLTAPLTALEMIKKEALARGLPEDVADELVRGLTRKIVEAM